MKIAIVTINIPSFNSAIKLDDILSEYQIDIFLNTKTKDLISLDKYPNHSLNSYGKLDDILPTAWGKYDAIICVLAIGAVIRKIAPYLKSKETDPAIIVINLDLTKIIPLLSGHIGGANQLSDDICTKLDGCINFITTATDQTKTIAFEMWAKQNNMEIRNLKALSNISNRLLNKQKVNIITYKNIFNTIEDKTNLIYCDIDEVRENSVIITPFNIATTQLHLKPKIFLGIGCNRDTSENIISQAVNIFLKENKLQFSQINMISSFEAKKDEKGLLDFARNNNLNIEFFDKNSINQLENNFTKSASTKFFGLKGVAEPSAILSSKYKKLAVQKCVYFKSVTMACAV
ncbi:MAG: cobalamin biosynthesis protein [Arcobacteraceae bacterium]|nr:cobalamin biosynthesis protein [Arcobacteraceae bacterium]